MKDQLTGGIDVRQIPIDKFPPPPPGYVWQLDANHLYLVDKDDPNIWHVSYDVPGGYISSHAEKEVVAYFIDAVRAMCASMIIPNKPINGSHEPEGES